MTPERFRQLTQPMSIEAFLEKLDEECLELEHPEFPGLVFADLVQGKGYEEAPVILWRIGQLCLFLQRRLTDLKALGLTFDEIFWDSAEGFQFDVPSVPPNSPNAADVFHACEAIKAELALAGEHGLEVHELSVFEIDSPIKHRRRQMVH